MHHTLDLSEENACLSLCTRGHVVRSVLTQFFRNGVEQAVLTMDQRITGSVKITIGCTVFRVATLPMLTSYCLDLGS